MAKSIFRQEPGECYICNMQGNYRMHTYLEEHHIFYGGANRKKSEKNGLKVNLCVHHHRGDINGNKDAVHFNRALDMKMKFIGQQEYEKTHSRDDFRKEFGKSWIL